MIKMLIIAILVEYEDLFLDKGKTKIQYIIIRECGSTLYVGMTRTATRAVYRLIQK